MILLVDDNQVQLGTRKTILERAGYTVRSASSGPDALEIVRDACNDLQLVMTDHIMPGMNGVGLVTELRETCPTVPVLVISGLPDAEPLYDGLDVTMAMKPVPPEELLRRVRELTSGTSLLSRTA